MFEGKVLFIPGKHRFKSVIFQIETLKFISIHSVLLLTFVKSSGFSLESLPSSETDIYSKVLFINLEQGAFFQNLVSVMTIF